MIPSAPSRKVYRIRKTPSRQPAPRMVCRILPYWYQGEIRVPPPFRGDRDQVFFLGIRRSEDSEIESACSVRGVLHRQEPGGAVIGSGVEVPAGGGDAGMAEGGLYQVDRGAVVEACEA